jgi:hypothetical protein
MSRKTSSKTVRRVRAWSFDEARKAVPYIAAIVRSLREQRLEASSRDIHARKLADRPGRPNRHQIIEQAEEGRLAREADEKFDANLAELNALDVYCTEPLRGEAYIPFVHDQKLAWFIFDLFDEEDHVREWRYHDDPDETRRPIAEALLSERESVRA